MSKRIGLKLLLILCVLVVIGISSGNDACAGEEKIYSVTDFGAVGDGVTLNTKALQKAIDTVNTSGGGKLIFPKGKFLSGYLTLKGGVHIVLEEGAVLLGSTNPEDYDPIQMEGRPSSPKNDDNSQLAFLVAFKADNFSITGKGMIDGQGRELALTIDRLHHEGVRVDPNYNHHRKRPRETVRPKLLRFSTCKDVEIRDVHLQNGACWGLSFELCTNLTLDNLTIVNMAYWNNDGMDITDCRNVRVTRCDVNSADDGICLKSYYPDKWNDQIYIADCTVRSSASAIKFGTASVGGFKNVKIENIKVYDTYRSAIAIESVDGGDIENIQVSNIEATNTGNALFIRLGHRMGEKPGTVKNVSIKNIKVQVPYGRPDQEYDIRAVSPRYNHNQFPAPIAGIPGHYIEDVTLENIEISYPGRASRVMAYVPVSRLDAVPEKIKNYPEYSMFEELPSWGFYVRHAKNIQMKNIRLTLEDADFRPAFVFDDVIGVRMEEISMPDDKKEQIVCKDSRDFELDEDILEYKVLLE